MGIDQFVVGHPEWIVDARHTVEMVSVSGRYHTFDLYLLGQITHQLSDRLLLIIAIAPQVADEQE